MNATTARAYAAWRAQYAAPKVKRTVQGVPSLPTVYR